MDNRTFKIAVIVSGIDEEYQNTILKGIHEFGAMHNINICHFMAYGGVLKNQTYDIGEFNIYNLVNYSKFDGAILLTNTISSPTITDNIIRKVREAGIPAVCIDNNIEGFYYIGIDNYTAMRGMVKHIVKHHKLTKINYISGPDDNPESILRLKAYRDVLSENNIPIEEERIYHGLFRGEDGRDAINAFLSSGLDFPEAIICANDAMALSAVIELEKYGNEVPESVLVTGFDSIYAARNYAPEISSVKRPLKRSGLLACKLILDHINGVENDRVNILPTEYIFAESCGCSNKIFDEISKFKKSNYRTIETYNIYTPMINRLSCELEQCQTFKENIAVIKGFVREIKCEKFFLCMCDDWDVDDNGETGKITSNGYTKKVTPVISYINGQFMEYPKFDSSEMLPFIHEYSSKSDNYYFVPIHFRDRCLGYCVVCNCQFPMESALYHTWVMSISNSIENIRKILCLDRMLQKLDQLSVTDPLVQIFNRNGLDKVAQPIFEQCIKRRWNVMIMFIDMDDLKLINDQYGHDEGDFSLHAIAEAMKYATKNNEKQIPARFGGDEFIIFAADTDEEQAKEIENKINSYLTELTESYRKPYSINVSTGYHITKASPSEPLNKLISAADKIMYENKKRKKSKNK